MKLLWVKGDFLHPTTKGGQIRTLETLKRLHQRHEVHYVGLNYPSHPEALARAPEYSSRYYAIPHSVPAKYSPGFALELAKGLVSEWPVGINRYWSPRMNEKIAELVRVESYDSIVCDFLNVSQNMPDLDSCVLFQHNVEAVIWKRQAEQASSLSVRTYFRLQAQRMLAYERQVCQRVKSIIAVSESDASHMRQEYGAARVTAIPTGVDIESFAPRRAAPVADLVFVGSMDWMPNIDGVTWFLNDVLPLIRKRHAHCTLAIVGRKPTAEITGWAARDSRIQVSGTVADVRPYLWGSSAAIVPLRVGGGTRLKIYEAMAAGIPVVSTTIGAEGLDIQDGENILLADDPQTFANCCTELLKHAEARSKMAATAAEMIRSRYSWDTVSQRFEELL